MLAALGVLQAACRQDDDGWRPLGVVAVKVAPSAPATCASITSSAVMNARSSRSPASAHGRLERPTVGQRERSPLGIGTSTRLGLVAPLLAGSTEPTAPRAEAARLCFALRIDRAASDRTGLAGRGGAVGGHEGGARSMVAVIHGS